MKIQKHKSNITNTILLVMLIQHMAFSAIINTSTSTAFSQPSFSIDFGSSFDRTTATAAVTDTKTGWDNFFTDRSSPVFSDTLTNVVKGSDNSLVGTQNEI